MDIGGAVEGQRQQRDCKGPGGRKSAELWVGALLVCVVRCGGRHRLCCAGAASCTEGRHETSVDGELDSAPLYAGRPIAG